MRKLLLITTALTGLAFNPTMARADPISTIVALMANGVSFGAALTATFGAVGAALVQLGGSFILSAAATALMGRPSAQSQRQELQRPTALPAYRFAYGRCWAPGTPVGWAVKGKVLYICYLLNSRPSALTSYTVYFDERAVVLDGNPFDFSGPGGSAVEDPFDDHVQIWIGRGDQVTCPAQLAAESEYFASTDAWRGRTVLWARLDCGKKSQRSERWPATPPALTVDGDWSLVFDPRDGLMKFSRNQALIVLDALRTNPIRAYADDFLMLDTFGWAADVAAQAVSVKAGGTIPRYRCDGVLVFADGAELEDQLDPLLAAGASRLVRVGGRLGIVPAIARDPVHTITDVADGQPLELTRWQPSDSLYTECVATYTAPDRNYETAEAPVYVVPGAVAADGGLPKRLDLALDFVTDHRQAQRLAKIAARRGRLQRAISAELWPDAFDLVAGSVASVDLGDPFGPWSGDYEVESIHPAAGINDDQSITLRLPATLRETSAAIYDWDAATEEQDVELGDLGATIGGVQAPGVPSVISGGAAALTSGEQITPRVQFTFAASASASAEAYEVQYRRHDGTSWGRWQAGGTFSEDAVESGTITGYVTPVSVGSDYQVQARTIGEYGKSGWSVSVAVTASAPANILATPDAPTVTALSSSTIRVRAEQIDDPSATHLIILRNTVNNSITAAEWLTIAAGASVAVQRDHTGLTSGSTWYYWCQARDQWGNRGGVSAAGTATTP